MKKFLITFAICFIATVILAGEFFRYYRARQKMPAPLAVQALQDRVTFIEGWTVQDMASYLGSGNQAKKITGQNLIPANDFLAAEKKFDSSNYSWLSSKPAQADLEGFLFPDTYFIPKTVPTSTTLSVIVIKKALDNFENKFTPDMEAQAAAQHMNVYQVLTLASIVEKETGRNALTQQQKDDLQQERKIIAGIFFNRLNISMPLESDATVNYITGKNTPSVTDQDTKIDSPYNTYLHAGLPPGPICNPSLSSIQAVLSPTKSPYFYFLHKQPSGDPVYSTTYAEHLQNKQKYLK